MRIELLITHKEDRGNLEGFELSLLVTSIVKEFNIQPKDISYDSNKNQSSIILTTNKEDILEEDVRKIESYIAGIGYNTKIKTS